MRIHRDQSRLLFRRQRRRRSSGLSLAVMLGVIIGGLAVSWNWIGGRLNFAAQPIDDSLQQAQDAFARGDLSNAVELAQRALEFNPNSDAALTLLTKALIYRSYSDYNRAVDRESALEWAAEGLALAPNSPQRLAIYAYALQSAGRPVEAARTAEAALKLDPQNPLARLAMGMAYGSVGSFEIALRESQQVAQTAEWQLDGQRAMALSYSDLGNYSSAIESIERAIGLNRYLVPLYFERALYALQIGDAGSATAAYYQVLTYDPSNVKARLRLCELSSLLRERAAAVEYCKEVTLRAPSWPNGWYQLGMEYFLQGSFASAQDAFHRCSSLQVMQNVPVSERRFECWYLQGQAAEILGDCDNLIATYNEFRAMATDETIAQRWTYPPEGPPTCAVTPAA
ncbi:MAG: tetratricopeptide repeat protein [Anaerolineae bacterium]|nr:tetratricopeptide repeat protein [Anaerolineae bacterium]